MGVNPDALYLDLLEDLSGWLSYSQRVSLETLGKCDSYPDSSTRQIAAVSMANSFFKKFKDRVSPEADATCLDKFLTVNDQCGTWKLELQDSGDELLFGEFKNLVWEFLYPNHQPLVSSFNQILDHGRMGPGVSVGAVGNDFYTKLFSSPLSCTSEGLLGAYSCYLSTRDRELSAEFCRQAFYSECEVVTGNRLSFVPKNADTSRSICIEPSLNMFYQLGLGAILERRLRQFFGIDFATQQFYNRELARIGSYDHKEDIDPSHDGLVTIDLSSASDSISMRMLQEVLPARFLDWLNLLRSPKCEIPNGRLIELNMVSTMGNGFTFPLQTMLFSCAVLAASRTAYRKESRNKRGKPGSFGVFGDDIIAGKSIAKRVIRLLNILGFQVNSEKSFLQGPFRESCGSDYFRGSNVRGVYIKSLKTPQAIYSSINQCNLWTARCGIPLSRTVRRLVRSCRYLPVPVWENDDAGIRCTYSNLWKFRWDKATQSLCYRRWVPRPSRITLGEGKVYLPRGQKPRIYNPDGLLIAFLRGDIEHGAIGVRQRMPNYTIRKGVAPNWDTTPVGSSLPEDIKLPDFGRAVAVNNCEPR
jgi:hypothetical protein